MGFSLRRLGRKITDIFDANSAEDQRKRLAAGQPRMYADQQRALGNRRPAQNVGQAFLGNTARVLNTGAGIAQETPATFKELAAQLSGNKVAESNAVDELNAIQERTRQLNSGLLGAGTIYNSPTEKLNPTETAKRFAPEYVGAVGEAAPIPAAKAFKGANLAVKAGKVGLASGTANLAADAGQQYAERGKIDPKRSALAFGTGTVLGAAAPLVGPTLSKTARGIEAFNSTPAGKSTIKALDSVPVGLGTKKVKAGDSTLHQLQADVESRYKVPAISKAKNKVLEAIYDPRAVEQKLDNQRFKQLKAAGKVKDGQKELLPNESLAAMRGRILNPYEPASVRDKIKYPTDKGDFSVNDIIKIYGPDDAKKAKDFEVYRIYKDELERQALGEAPSMPVAPEEMSKYVGGYEKSNPDALAHNAALRAKALKDVADLEAQGSVAPGTAENLSRYQHYTPRKLQAPEDKAAMQISGGIKGGQRGVQGRTQFNEAPSSPLSLHKQGSVTTERDIANQMYGQELVKRINEGDLPGGKIAVNAEDVIKRKELIATAKDYLESFHKASVRRANVKADLRTSNILKGGAEYQAAQKAKQALLSSVESADAKAAISKLSRKDLVEVFKSMVDEGTPNIERLRTNLIKKSKANASLADELAALKQQIQIDQETARGLKNAAYDLNNKTSRNTEAFPYRVNGEVGKVDLPGELAQSISKQNEVNFEKTIGKSLRGFSNVQKAFWTGILQPAFKAWNVLVKNPILMFVNGDGLSGVRPEVAGSFARQILHTEKMQTFKQEMLKRGIAYENAFQSKNIQQETARDIAERANLVTFFARNPVRTFKDFYRGLNTAFASVDNAQRYAVATGAYKRAKGLGFSENEALDIASQASAKIFGDFNRITQLAQAMEPLIPYTGATQAGQRALIRSAKTRPVETAIKVTALGTGMAAFANYSLQNANEYYNDMIAQGKEFYLDNNITIALPGAHKNDKGEWQGIVSIPLLPDIRPMNRAIWREAHNVANGHKIDPGLIASEAFNQITGDARNQVYDSSRAKQGGPAMGLLPSSPIATFGKTVSNVNTYNGGQLADEYLQNKPRTEQFTKNTSDSAKSVSKLTKGALTPLQIDQLAGSAGTAGDVFQKPKEAPKTIAKSFVKPVKPGKSQTEKQKSGANYYKDVSEVSKTIKNKDDFRVFQGLASKNSEKTPDDGAARAKELLARPGVLSAFAQIDKRKRARGESGDAFFDLTPEQQQKVLRYRGAKDLNSAKQAYDKDGNPLFTSLGLDEKWYSDYKDKEDAQYAKLGNKNEMLTYSGAKKPDNKAIKPVEDAYYKLPKGTGARKAYLAAHPELTDYWAASNQFSNAERLALGLDVNTTGDSSGSGSGGGSSKYGGGGSSKKSATYGTNNPYEYSIGLKTGGKAAKPTVKQPSKAKAKIGKKKGGGKPKVSIKKSLV